ncbi:MAG: hypothetical protein AB8B65_03965 [Kordia sp.]|uniref:hypothetical protein n=1 Tax=Kordia sp. TaxID=1965332 RepID=UPI00385DBCB1
MKKRGLKSLNLNKKSVSNLNQIVINGGAVGSSKSRSGGTCCLSCTRSCNPDCKLTLADVDCAKEE